MTDYSGIEIKDLTVDDALKDAEWAKKPKDTADYFAFDLQMLRLFKRLTDAELASMLRAICEYTETGEIPDYEAQTTAVAIMLEAVISTHERRINRAYLNSYKAYVKGKQPKKKD